MTIKNSLITKLYADGLSTAKIASKLNCNPETIRKRLINLGVPRRGLGPAPTFNITKTFLVEQYIKQEKSMRDIAKELNCGETLIHKSIHGYKIPIRARSESLMGRIRTIEHSEKISQAKIGSSAGPKNPNWKNGADMKNLAIRRSAEYIRWRKQALRHKGDFCGKCGKNLTDTCPCCSRKFDRHVHHVKEFANNPHERFSLHNALVLCESCHRSHHKK